MTRARQPIGVFDSGIGGLTVVRELVRRAPHEPIVYYGDTARVPYGTKSPHTVWQYSREITRFLAYRGVKMIVVACNTASAVAIDAVREGFDGPVVGVIEPGARAAVAAVRTRHKTPPWRVGVIGTRATINSEAYPRAISAIDPRIEVFSAACPLLVPLAEEGWFGHPATREIIHTYLKPLLERTIGTLILGCTHYPLLQDDIQSETGSGVQLISSAEETARTVVELLERYELKAPGERTTRNIYYASDDIRGFRQFHERIVGDNNAIFIHASEAEA